MILDTEFLIELDDGNQDAIALAADLIGADGSLCYSVPGQLGLGVVSLCHAIQERRRSRIHRSDDIVDGKQMEIRTFLGRLLN